MTVRVTRGERGDNAFHLATLYMRRQQAFDRLGFGEGGTDVTYCNPGVVGKAGSHFYHLLSSNHEALSIFCEQGCFTFTDL